MADNKNIEVGGRLHSIATGNVLAGANEILDDTINKKQSEINTETYRLVENINESLENLNPEQSQALSVAAKANNNEVKLGYFECETESNIAAKVITNATGYILSKGGCIKIKMINANTASNVTLNINSTGAKTLYYNGELASPTNTWENNEIIEVYYDGNNYYYANNIEGAGKFSTGQKVKNVGIGDVPGTSQTILMSQKGVTDITSEYNVSTNNNNAEYTFAQAVALVPASLQKGGLTIKYIDSTTHEYAIKRLMSSTWNTTESNWQGIDDEPTAGSDNLVKSGGVKHSSELLRYQIGEINGDSVSYEDAWNIGFYLNPKNGNQVSSQAWGRTVPILLHSGDTISVKTQSTNFVAIAQTDVNESYYTKLVWYVDSDTSLKWYKYTAIDDIYVVCFGKVSNNDVDCKITYPKVYSTLQDLSSNTQKLSSINGLNKPYSGGWKKGFYIDISSHTQQQSQSWGRTEPILLHKNETILVCTQSTGFVAIAQTDASESYYTDLVHYSGADTSLKWYKYTAIDDIYVVCFGKVSNNDVECKISYPTEINLLVDKVVVLDGIGVNAEDAGISGNDKYYFNTATNKVVYIYNYTDSVVHKYNPLKDCIYVFNGELYTYNGKTLVKSNAINLFPYNKDNLTTGCYYYSVDGSLLQYSKWNATPLIPVNHLNKYIYKGYSVIGSTTAICYYKDNNSLIGDFIGYEMPQTGTHELTVPSNAKYVGFSINNANKDTFSLWVIKEYLLKEELDTALDLYKIEKYGIYNLPSVDKSLTIVDKPYIGLAYSDSVNWRYSKDDKIVISAETYKTVRISDQEAIGGYDTEKVNDAFSVTKLLTAIVTEQYVTNWNEQVTVIALDCRYEFNSPKFVKAGDVVTYNDLLNSAIIQSDNNAAEALTRLVGYIINPSAADDTTAMASFYSAMATQATSIGMSNTTNFIHGFDGLKTTPTDICKMLIYIYNNCPQIKSVWGLLNYSITAGGTNPRTWTINSTTTTSARNIIPEFVGGKTGSGATNGTYAIVWKDGNDVYYASCLMNFTLATGNRFKDMRRIIDEAEGV